MSGEDRGLGQSFRAWNIGERERTPEIRGDVAAGRKPRAMAPADNEGGLVPQLSVALMAAEGVEMQSIWPIESRSSSGWRNRRASDPGATPRIGREVEAAIPAKSRGGHGAK